MTKRYFIYIILIILLLVFGFDKSNDDPFSKFKTFPPNINVFPNDPSIDVVALSYFWGIQYGSQNVKQELRCCGNGKNRTIGHILIPYKCKHYK